MKANTSNMDYAAKFSECRKNHVISTFVLHPRWLNNRASLCISVWKLRTISFVCRHGWDLY